MLLQIDYLLLLLQKSRSEAVHKQALSDRIQTGVEYRLRRTKKENGRETIEFLTPPSSTKLYQSVDPCTHNPKVGGSNPPPATIYKVKRCRHLQRFSVLAISHEKWLAWHIRGIQNSVDLPLRKSLGPENPCNNWIYRFCIFPTSEDRWVLTPKVLIPITLGK